MAPTIVSPSAHGASASCTSAVAPSLPPFKAGSSAVASSMLCEGRLYYSPSGSDSELNHYRLATRPQMRRRPGEARTGRVYQNAKWRRRCRTGSPSAGVVNRCPKAACSRASFVDYLIVNPDEALEVRCLFCGEQVGYHRDTRVAGMVETRQNKRRLHRP